jgi:hypothetical protein
LVNNVCFICGYKQTSKVFIMNILNFFKGFNKAKAARCQN